MDKFDLPKQPEPKSDADLYSGEQLPDVTSVQEFVGDETPFSIDKSEVKKQKNKRK